MRVLFITSAYPASADDPRGAFIHELARALVEAGVCVKVLAPGAPGAPSRESRDGVEIYRARYWWDKGQWLARGPGGIVPNLQGHPWLAAQVPTLVGSLIWHAVRLARTVDLIHAHWVYPSGLAGAAASRFYSKPLVLTSHGGDLNLAAKSIPLTIVCGWLSRRARICVGVSWAMAEAFMSVGAPKHTVRMIPLGVTQTSGTKRLDKLPEDVARFASFPGLRVVYAGRLIPSKSVDTLVAAHARLVSRGRQVALLVLGDGPTASDLKRMVADAAPNSVVFAGQQPPWAVRELMRLGEVLVLPSKSEGRGLVLVEAMLANLAVVAANIHGARELVETNYNGLLFESGNVDDLCAALDRLLKEPQLLRACRRNGPVFVARHRLGMDVCVKAHIALYDEVQADCGSMSNGRAREQRVS